MLTTTFDHLVFGCYFLRDGVDFMAEQLGVRPRPGGQHLTMGTHNAVLKLAGATYLEVIAIDPDLPKPARPRWFGLDHLQPGSPPRLLTWVVSTNDVQRAVRLSPLQHGNVESLQRGAYQWQISIPADGRMPLRGIAPTVIQWQGESHPAQVLPPSGVTLAAMEARHPHADRLNAWLHEIGYDGIFTAVPTHDDEPGGLTVTLRSPSGTVTFASRG